MILSIFSKYPKRSLFPPCQGSPRFLTLSVCNIHYRPILSNVSLLSMSYYQNIHWIFFRYPWISFSPLTIASIYSWHLSVQRLLLLIDLELILPPKLHACLLDSACLCVYFFLMNTWAVWFFFRDQFIHPIRYTSAVVTMNMDVGTLHHQDKDD